MVDVENKIQRYESYKDSGVEWLGDIPEHWELTRLGTRFEERRTKVSDKDYPPLSVTKNGTVPQLSNAAKTNDGDNRKLVKKGDFVINSRSDRKGSSGIAYQDGSVSLINIVMEPLNIHPIYCNYLLKCYSFIEEFYRMGHGIVADLWTTRYDEMKAIMVGIPPLPEQTAIAQFLDDKTTKIDQAIVIKQQQIALLKERKQILIHKAVTKGVTSSVFEMKDSGVEWIGEIPKHWEVLTLKKMISTGYIQFQDGNHGGDYPRENEFSEIGVPFIKPRDMQNGEILFESSDKLPLERALKLRIGFAKKGDTLMVNRGGSIGKTCFVTDNFGEQEFFIINPQVTYLRPLKNLNSKYLNFLCESNIIQVAVDMILGYGSTFSFLGLGNMGKFPIPVPPLSEQKEIAQYIETASAKIETAISLKEQEISKLQEYKSSLINSVVTGKVRVC